MMKPVTQINELLLTSPKEKSTCKTFISQIDPGIEQKLGRLFGIIEIESRDKENSKTIKTIIKEMESLFYGLNEQDDIKESSSYSQLSLTEIKNTEAIFEDALQKLNQKLAQMIKDGGNNFLPENLNIIIGVIKNNSLIFTHIGKINAFLVHKKKNNDYSITNILDSNSGNRQLNLIRIFSEITSGSVSSEDIIIFSTPSLFDYFSLDKLKNTVTTFTLPSAIHQLRTSLVEANTNLNFGSIIIKLVNQREKIASLTEEKMLPSSSQASMTELSLTHEKTKEFLTPSLISTIKKRSIKTFSVLSEKIKNESYKIQEWKKERHKQKKQNKQSAEKKDKNKNKIPSSTTVNKKEVHIKNTATRIKKNKQESSLFKNIFIQFKKQIYFLVNAFFGQFKKITNAFKKLLQKIFSLIKRQTNITANIFNNPLIDGQKIKTKSQELLELVKRIIYYLKLKFKQLPKTSKILFIFSIALALLFVSSIIILDTKQKKEAIILASNNKIKSIQDKINNAEASIIYNDEIKGRNLLMEAQSLVNNLPENLMKNKEIKNQFQVKISSLLNQLRHINNIINPELLSDFTKIDPTIKLEKLTLHNGNLFTFNPDNNVIYRLRMNEENAIEIMEGNSTNLGNLKLATSKDNQSILFFHNNQGLLELNINNNSLQEKNITLTGDNPDIKDIEIFNNNLYLLDDNNKQIYKHRISLSGYARGTSWIKENTEQINNLASMAIDGSIYALKTNGEILQFINGRKQDFKAAQPDPAWANPSKIFTSRTSDYLYVLDKKEKRIVVLDKRGRLITQYFSDKFNNLKDFAINEQEKSIYILNGAQIYSIKAEHLQ